MRLAGYVRVSTSEQVEHGQGLDIQEKALRRWAKAQGHKLEGIYRDEGISGKVEAREGLEDALASIRYNGAEGLVVTTLDRLARSLTVQEGALASVWNAGGAVFTVDGGEVLADDPDDPMRTFVRQVMGAVSQLEAGMIARRMRKGREAKKARTGWAGGQVPYGWKSENAALIEDEAEQEVLRMMQDMRAGGASLRSIADSLNAQGIAAKKGGQWHPQTVAYALDHGTH